MPEVYYTYDATEQFPIDVLCMEKINGVNALMHLPFLFCSKKKRARFADIVTDALGKIHEVKSDRYGFIASKERYDTWREFYFKLANEVFTKAQAFLASGRLKPAIFSLLEKGMRNFDFIVDGATVPTLLHGDLNIANIMAEKKTFIPTGIIDPFNSMWGDTEYDLFQLNMLTGARCRLFKTYQRKFKTSEKAELKCAFYALVNEVLCHVTNGTSSRILFFFIIKRIKKQYKIWGI